MLSSIACLACVKCPLCSSSAYLCTQIKGLWSSSSAITPWRDYYNKNLPSFPDPDEDRMGFNQRWPLFKHYRYSGLFVLVSEWVYRYSTQHSFQKRRSSFLFPLLHSMLYNHNKHKQTLTCTLHMLLRLLHFHLHGTHEQIFHEEEEEKKKKKKGRKQKLKYIHSPFPKCPTRTPH